MRLLASIEALLESLQKWSEQQTTDMDLSNAYVQLARDFDGAVAEFAVYGIEIRLVPLLPSPPFPDPNHVITETPSRSIENSILFPRIYETSWRSV